MNRLESFKLKPSSVDISKSKFQIENLIFQPSQVHFRAEGLQQRTSLKEAFFRWKRLSWRLRNHTMPRYAINLMVHRNSLFEYLYLSMSIRENYKLTKSLGGRKTVSLKFFDIKGWFKNAFLCEKVIWTEAILSLPLSESETLVEWIKFRNSKFWVWNKI